MSKVGVRVESRKQRFGDVRQSLVWQGGAAVETLPCVGLPTAHDQKPHDPTLAQAA